MSRYHGERGEEVEGYLEKSQKTVVVLGKLTAAFRWKASALQFRRNLLYEVASWLKSSTYFILYGDFIGLAYKYKIRTTL